MDAGPLKRRAGFLEAAGLVVALGFYLAALLLQQQQLHASVLHEIKHPNFMRATIALTSVIRGARRGLQVGGEQTVNALNAVLLPGGTAAAGEVLGGGAPADALAWLQASIVAPIYSGTVCGDGLCHSPFEYPAFGSLGCAADCGAAATAPVLLRMSAAFTPAVDPTGAAAASVTYNLCWAGSPLAGLGYPDPCWWSADQGLPAPVGVALIRADLPLAQTWYIRLRGDVRGRTEGALYGGGALMGALLPSAPAWTLCGLEGVRSAAPAQRRGRGGLREAGPPRARRHR